MLVRGRVRRLVDPCVDAPAEMLDERPEEPRVDGRNRDGGIDGELCSRHVRYQMLASVSGSKK